MVPVPDPIYPDEPLVSDDPTPQRTEAPTEVPEVGRTRNPVEVLREQLGWGNSNNDDAQARNADAGTVGSQSDVSASAQTVLPDSDDAIGRPSVNARATPLGRYVDSVDKIIRERWFAAEIDPMHRALGIEGTVVVQLDIRRSGRVADVKVYASSGYPHLDAVALAAIPSKVPRIPKELDLEHLAHRISLRDLRGQEDRPPRRVGN
jgi:TonB family protein